jgi:hypothetical protein
VESVEEQKRRGAYERSQALRRIEDETARTRQLMQQRRQLQDQRRMANMHASLQRQQIVQVGCWGCITDEGAGGGRQGEAGAEEVDTCRLFRNHGGNVDRKGWAT